MATVIASGGNPPKDRSRTLALIDALPAQLKDQQDLDAIQQAFGSGGTQQEQLQRLISENPRAFLQNAPALKSFMELSEPAPTGLSEEQLTSVGLGAPQQTTQVIDAPQAPQVSADGPALGTFQTNAELLKNISRELRELPLRRKDLKRADPTLESSDLDEMISEERASLKEQAETLRKKPKSEVSVEVKQETGKRRAKDFNDHELERLNGIVAKGDQANRLLASNTNLAKSVQAALKSKATSGVDATKAIAALKKAETLSASKLKEAIAPDGSKVFVSELAIINGQGEMRPPVGNLKSVLDLSDPANPKQVFATNEQIANSQNNYIPVPAGTVIRDTALKDEEGNFVKDDDGNNIFRSMKETFPGSGVFEPIKDKQGNPLDKIKSIGGLSKLAAAVGELTKSTRTEVQKTIISADDRLRGIARLERDFDANFLTTNGRLIAAIQKISDKWQIVDAKTLAKVAKFIPFVNEGDPITDPDFVDKAANFFAKSQSEFLLFRKFITGVAGGEKELEEIRASFFDIKGDSPKTYLAKLAAIKEITQDIKDSREALLASGLIEGTDAFNAAQSKVVKQSFAKRGKSLKRETGEVDDKNNDLKGMDFNGLIGELTK